MKAHDVAVVGGRVAGAGTALLLARTGLRVVVLERGRRGTDTVSTHALMRAGVLQLSRWGLLGSIVDAGTPPVRRTTFHYDDGDPFEVAIRPSAGVDALYAPRRHLLDGVLVDAAEAAGAEVLHETAVTGLLRGDGGRVTGVRARGRGGVELLLPATVTVGADGLRSVVAAEAGAPVLRRGGGSGAVLYRYFSELAADGYEWAYGDRIGAGVIPTNAGQALVFAATDPAAMRVLRRSGAETAFLQLLDRTPATARLGERVRDATPVGRMHGWGGAPGQVRRAWGAGWALVGDAGYFRDPITAHGITDALRDAELLASALLDVLTCGAPAPIALASYQATRDRLSRELWDVTEQVAGYAWDTPRIRALLRGVSRAMGDEVDHLAALPDRFRPVLPCAGRRREGECASTSDYSGASRSL